jgi:hypothetical protein
MTRSEKLFEALLGKQRNDLAPGAEDQLRRRFLGSQGPQRSPAQVAGELIGFLASHADAPRYFKPGRKFADEGETTLQAVCRRWPLADPSKAAEVAEELHFAIGHMPAAEIAAAVARHFEARGEWDKLAPELQPPLPAHELKVRAALDWCSPGIDRSKIADVCRRWGPEIGNGSPTSVLERVVARLEHPHLARAITTDGLPIVLTGSERASIVRDRAAYDREFEAANGGEASAKDAASIRSMWALGSDDTPGRGDTPAVATSSPPTRKTVRQSGRLASGSDLNVRDW